MGLDISFTAVRGDDSHRICDLRKAFAVHNAVVAVVDGMDGDSYHPTYTLSREHVELILAVLDSVDLTNSEHIERVGDACEWGFASGKLLPSVVVADMNSKAGAAGRGLGFYGSAVRLSEVSLFGDCV